MEFSVPRISDRVEQSCSAIRSHLKVGPERREHLAVKRLAKGLNTRAAAETFIDDGGRTAASEIAERLGPEYEAFATRALPE